MFIDGNAIEAELLAELELIEIAVVELRTALRVIEAVGRHDPGRRIGRCALEIQVGVRHQVEQRELHGKGLIDCCNSAASSSGRST